MAVLTEAPLEKYKFVRGTPTLAPQLTASDYPVSGAYIDISATRSVIVLIMLGAIAAADVPTFELKSTDGISGTLVSIDPIFIKSPADTDDEKVIVLQLETGSLDDGQTHLSVVASGATLVASFAHIVFLLDVYPTKPPLQDEAILPLAFQGIYGGGQGYQPI